MTTRQVEAALEQLARQFAFRLLRGLLSVPFSELGALLEARVAVPAARPSVAGSAPVRRARPPRKAPRARRASSVESSLSGRASAVRVSTAGAGIARVRKATFDALEAELSGDMITDPGLLLEVIGRKRASVLPPPPEATTGRASTELLSTSLSTSKGPALRPGERLQRTAGGNLVLRRGTK